MKRATLVFDFDGTIADSVPRILRMLVELAEELGYPGREVSLLPNLRDMSVPQLLTRIGFPMYRLPGVVKKVRRDLNQHIPELTPIVGMPEALDKLRSHGIGLGILTSNSKENVEAFLQANEMAAFDFIYCGSSLFGKAAVIKKLLKNRELNRDEVFYVGDELRDIEAAKSIGVKIISVAWGFNSAKALGELAPEYLALRPEDICRAVGIDAPSNITPNCVSAR